MSAERIHGACKCGQRVIKELNSPNPLFNGTRYAYPDSIDTDMWCIFRCERCLHPIDETFLADFSEVEGSHE